MRPKPSSRLKKAAFNANKALSLLQQGKSAGDIAGQLGVKKSTALSYIRVLRGGFSRKMPAFVPPPNKRILSRERRKKTLDFIRLAKRVIDGKAKIKRKPLVSLVHLPAAKHSQVVLLLMQNPTSSIAEIAKTAGTSMKAVSERRERLIQEGHLQPITRSQIMKLARRNPGKITGVLGEEQIKDALQRLGPRIKSKAAWVYSQHRTAFDSANITKEDIADELSDRMEWALKIYSGKIKGPEETKLERFINFKLKKLSLTLAKGAWKKHDRYKAALSSIKPKSADQGVDLFSVGKLEEISVKLSLSPVEKAVLFGFGAGFFEREIGKSIEISESHVSQLRKKLFPRVKRLLES